MTTQPMCPACPDAPQIFIARSHKLALSRCPCGRYWLVLSDHSEERHPAEGCEQALAEIIESLARLKLPGALCEGRRA